MTLIKQIECNKYRHREELLTQYRHTTIANNFIAWRCCRREREYPRDPPLSLSPPSLSPLSLSPSNFLGSLAIPI